MNICGIIAEYNPFHKGHAYLIETARAASATHIVAAMSGDFVQRAEPAVMDKFARARVAVSCGADLVCELPVQYATASAERFALGAVQTLMGFGCIDMLAFGSKSGSLKNLEQAADVMNSPEMHSRIKTLSEGGLNYAAARERAARELFGKSAAEIFDSPDNILATEYIRALKKLACPMKPFTAERIGASHDDESGVKEGVACASFIRESFRAGLPVEDYLPPPSYEALTKARQLGEISGGWPALERVLLAKLRSMSREDFARLPDSGGGLGDRLFRAAAGAKSAGELFTLAKTKRYTMARVRRVALAALLEIDCGDFFPAPYIRILAVGEKGGEILKRAKSEATLPLSESLKKLEDSGWDRARSARLSALASDIFSLSLPEIPPKGRDYTQKLYILQAQEQDG
ncbi:MAG: nucleotidyltransferase family protein [Oscillospiraceae bacterium]|nr:nucleotidyltransferase family protein [Oscillospiraceae bacterium]